MAMRLGLILESYESQTISMLTSKGCLVTVIHVTLEAEFEEYIQVSEVLISSSLSCMTRDISYKRTLIKIPARDK